MRRWTRSMTGFLGIGALALAVTSVEAHPVNTYPGFRGKVITKKEGKQLAKHRHHVVRVRDRALRDGYVTRKEAKRINKAQRKLTRYRAQATNDYANRDHPWGWDAWRSWWTGDRFDNRRDNRHDQGHWDGNRGRSRWDAKGDHHGWYDGDSHQRQHDHQDRQGRYSMRDRQR